MCNCKQIVDYFAEIKKITAFELLKRKWSVLKETTHILSIPYNATISLQKQSLTLSDVFGIWLQMELHMKACETHKKYRTKLAKLLLTTFNERKETVFGNALMTSAIFLDPRFRSQIVHDENKMSLAKETLKNIWRRLNTTENDVSVEVSDVSGGSNASSNVSFEFDEATELDNFLASSRASNESHPNQTEIDIDFVLDSFNPEPIKCKDDILIYWETIKNNAPSLYKIAMVVFAIPPTEVQIERDFSKLNFVFSNRRCRLTEERLEDIMAIHLNDELFHEVKQKELLQLYDLIKQKN